VGKAWRVRRPPRDFELFLARRARALAASVSAPGEGEGAQSAPAGLSP
jgi:hypothetical protein